MYPIKKVLVGLDLSELDTTLIQFASAIAKLSSSKTIYFINVIKSLHTLPEEIKKEFPKLVQDTMEGRAKQLEKEVATFWNADLDTQVEISVRKGQPAKQILNWSKHEKIDLILVGRKIHLEGSGVLSQRLARRAGCSLLIVPEGSTPKFNKILVPIDFSDYSEIAMEEAIAIAKSQETPTEIICQNVYTVPVGYHYTGKSYKEFSDIMQKHAKKEYETFISKIDTKGLTITPIYSHDEADDAIKVIYQKAVDIEADIIIIGARGRTPATALFLGSTAERLIQIDTKVPLLVVRPKGKVAGIIDYIRQI